MKNIRWALLAAEAMVLLALMTIKWGEVLPADAAVSIPETKYVALTFDDGPRRGTTDRLLDGLAQRGVPVTFFLIGQQIEYFPELVRGIRWAATP